MQQELEQLQHELGQRTQQRGRQNSPGRPKGPWTHATGTEQRLSAGDGIQTNVPSPSHPPPPLYHADDHSAIEIHQSKSYIVNLIDRALSREFRTLPEDRAKVSY